MTNWKTIAIIFIILFVVGTIYAVYSIGEYLEDIDREEECITDVCAFNDMGISAKADSYLYDLYTRSCYCYKDSEVVDQQRIK